MKTFRISFSGETLPGVDRDVAKRGLAQFYKLENSHDVEGFFTGKTLTLRRRLSKEDAATLYVTLRKLGLDIRIEAEAEAADTLMASKEEAPTETAPKPNDLPKTKPRLKSKPTNPDSDQAKPAKRLKQADQTTPPRPKRSVRSPAKDAAKTTVASSKSAALSNTPAEPSNKPAAASSKTAAAPNKTAAASSKTAAARSKIADAPTPRRKQRGAPNLFDLRAAGAETSSAQPADMLAPSAFIGAAILTLALLLIAFRFLVSSIEEAPIGLGAITVGADGSPAVIVNDQLLRHDRAGLPGALEDGAALKLAESAQLALPTRNILITLRRPFDTWLPASLQSLLGIHSKAGQLDRCQLDQNRCETLRADLSDAAFVLSPRNDSLILADAKADQLLLLGGSGQTLASQPLPLSAPLSLSLSDGLLFLIQAGEPVVNVIKPDAEDFGSVLERIELEGADFPVAMAPLGRSWWLLDQTASTSESSAANSPNTRFRLLEYDRGWTLQNTVLLPEGSRFSTLVPWAAKLLLADTSQGQVLRVAADGVIEAPLSEEAINEVIAKRDKQEARGRALQLSVLAILSLLIAALLAFGSFKALQHKVYRVKADADEAEFDISSNAIDWLDPAPDPTRTLRRCSLGLLLSAPLLLFAAAITPAGITYGLALALLSIGFAGLCYGLEQSIGCHLGKADDCLVLVDHRRYYRVGRGPRVQYLNNFVMIDDVVVYLGNRLLPLFSEDALKTDFEPLVKRGIRVDGTTLRIKLIDLRHPLVYGVIALSTSVIAALLVILIS